VSNRCLRPLAVFVAIVYLCIPARSQTPEVVSTIKGELRSESTVPFHDYLVEIADLGRSTDTRRTEVQFDGTFQLRDIHSGTYTLRVTTLGGDLVHQELVTVAPQTGPLTVRLPARPVVPSAPGTISFTQLQHPPSRKAFQAMEAAQRYSDSGHTEKAVEELEKAIRISPEYADAYNNLAVQHIRMGHFQEACDEFSQAIAIAGPNTSRLSNLAYAQGHLHRFPEAIESARAALRLDPSSAQAHLILGSLLAVDPRTRAESIPHLERAAETMPSARTILESLRERR
jgi:tetratricopeptide (TPR) repeat protein